MKLSLILLSIALTFPRADREPEKVPEYVFLPVCVDQILVNNEKWHCIVSDPEKVEGLVCDPGSMIIVLKKGVTRKSCVTVNMVVPTKKVQ